MCSGRQPGAGGTPRRGQRAAPSLESRGLIERAKGVLMHRHGWTADEPFQYLVRLSQHTNIRLAELADRVVAAAATARGIAPSDDAWAHRLLDLLAQPAMMLRSA